MISSSALPTTPARAFYVTGGTVPRDAPSYIVRKADTDLLQGLRGGHFCYVLTSRQMGKSSLMVRAAIQLRHEGVTCIILDLTAIGQNLDAERWYGGLLNQVGQQVGLEDELDDFWLAPSPLGPMHRWMQALQQIVLPSRVGNLAIFVDEIDAVRSLPFSADEFFAGIRQCYNHRSENPELERLTFCLLGVATPSDLIRDTRTTPFNIGKRIELTDFTQEEAAALKAGLLANAREVKQADQLLGRVLYWTGGHPYLTQRLCQAIAERLAAPVSDTQRTKAESSHPTALVDALCGELFLSSGARERDDNLIFVRERLLRSEVDIASLLDLYGRVRQGKRVANEEANALVSLLRLAGIVQVTDRFLTVRNRIYAQVFDRKWVRGHMPDAELRRQQAAYRRGMLRTASVFLIVLTMGIGLAVAMIRNKHSQRLADAQKQIISDAQKARDVQKRLTDEAQIARDHANQQAQVASRERLKAETARSQAVAAQRQTEKARQQALMDRKDALHQRAIAQEKGREADTLRQLAAQRALLEKARSLRLSGDIGRRFESLATLQQALKMPMSSALRLELRNEAIACLSLPIDLRPLPGQTWHGTSFGEGSIGVKSDGSGYYYSDAKGNISLHSLADEHAILSLSGFGQRAVVLLRQSRDGRYVAVRYSDNRIIVWDTVLQRQVRTLIGYYTWKEFDFSPDGRAMVDITGQRTGTVAHLRELPSGREYKQIPLSGDCWVVRYHPNGRKLAFAYRSSPQIQIYDLETEQREMRRLPSPASALDWSSDGKRLAGSCENRVLYIWDGETGRQIVDMYVHTRPAPTIAFNHRGDILSSISWDGTTCFCNAADGALLMRCSLPTETLEFSPDDRYVVLASEISVQRWQVTDMPFAPAFSVLAGHGNEIWDIALHPNGWLAAVVANTGIKLWDVAHVREVGVLPIGHTRSALFSADGKSLFTSGPTGVRRWEVHSVATSTREMVRIGPAKILRINQSVMNVPDNLIGLSCDERMLATTRNEACIEMIDAWEGNSLLKTATSDKRLGDIAISPENRYLAAGFAGGNNVLVWDGKTGKQVAELPTALFTSPVFSPDGRWLVTGSSREFRFWSVPAWKPGFQIKRDLGTVGTMAFSPDGNLFAAAISTRKIWLGDPVTHSHFATLEWPEAVGISRVHFDVDGSRLVVLSTTGVRIYDLRKVRRQLAAMGLDWNTPPLPSAPHQADRQRELMQTLDVTIVADEVETRAARTDYMHRLEQLLQVTPPDANIYNTFAWIYCSYDPQRAIELAQKANQLAPDMGIYKNTLGIAYYRAGQFTQAVEALHDSMRLNKGNFLAYDLYFLAMSYQHLGDRQQAQDCYAQAVRWHEAQQQLNPTYAQELAVFRKEAEAVLNTR